MPSAGYFRKQAQLFARLAVTTSDAQMAERYNRMALEQLAKAEEVEPGAGQQRLTSGGSDTDGTE